MCVFVCMCMCAGVCTCVCSCTYVCVLCVCVSHNCVKRNFQRLQTNCDIYTDKTDYRYSGLKFNLKLVCDDCEYPLQFNS